MLLQVGLAVRVEVFSVLFVPLFFILLYQQAWYGSCGWIKGSRYMERRSKQARPSVAHLVELSWGNFCWVFVDSVLWTMHSTKRPAKLQYSRGWVERNSSTNDMCAQLSWPRFRFVCGWAHLMNPGQIPTKNGVAYEDLQRDFPSMDNQIKAGECFCSISFFF